MAEETRRRRAGSEAGSCVAAETPTFYCPLRENSVEAIPGHKTPPRPSSAPSSPRRARSRGPGYPKSWDTPLFTSQPPFTRLLVRKPVAMLICIAPSLQGFQKHNHLLLLRGRQRLELLRDTARLALVPRNRQLQRHRRQIVHVARFHAQAPQRRRP
jgi:hypothetical protein